MRLFTILLFIFSNAAWAFVCIVLSYQPETFQSFLARFGIQTTFAFQTFIPHALALALVTQLLIFAIFYGVTARGTLLKTWYKKESEKNKELKGKQKEIEQTLKEKSKDLDAAAGAEQQVSILSERTHGLEDLVDELRHQNDLLQQENTVLAEKAQRLERSAEGRGTIVDGIRNFFDGFTQKK